MSATHRTNIGVTLLCIHKCVTRGVEVSMRNSRKFEETGFPDQVTRMGFTSYVGSLASVLHAHHLSEDEVAFPYFKEKYPQAPYDTLAETHRQIVPILKGIEAALDRSAENGKGLSELSEHLTTLDALWHPHIQLEEQYFSPEQVDELVSLEDQKVLGIQIGQHNQKYAIPDYLTVPFVFFNLSGEDREYMEAEVPPIVIQQLVPQVWKDKWWPMMPFLLA